MSCVHNLRMKYPFSILYYNNKGLLLFVCIMLVLEYYYGNFKASDNSCIHAYYNIIIETITERLLTGNFVSLLLPLRTGRCTCTKKLYIAS